jgi:hypothetical protein
METILSNLLSRTLNDISTGQLNTDTQFSAFDQVHTRSERDIFEHNLQLLQLIRTIENERNTHDIKRRQMRIVSDLMEDYQHNIQLFLHILSQNTQNANRQSQRQNRTTRPTTFAPRVSPNTGLTDRQVELLTRTIVYDTSLNEPRCPISLEDFIAGEEIVQIIGCGHYFKCGALREWFNRHTQCPVCRYNVTNSAGRGRNGNSAPIYGNVNVPMRDSELGNTRTTADTWTTILTGLLTSPDITRLYTVEHDIVLPMTFDNQEEVD